MTGKSGKCEECAKLAQCNKTIGIMFGFCNTDFEPKAEQGTGNESGRESTHH